jgi:hypothetical protein
LTDSILTCIKGGEGALRNIGTDNGFAG